MEQYLLSNNPMYLIFYTVPEKITLYLLYHPKLFLETKLFYSPLKQLYPRPPMDHLNIIIDFIVEQKQRDYSIT
jgi:hypothetical protein